MVGVWIAPVIAQVMMTLSVTAMESNSQRSSSADVARRPPLVGGQRHQTPVSPFLTFDKLIGGQPCAALALNLRQHRPGPIDASLHLLKQVRIDTLIAVDIVAHTGGGVEIDRLEWPHEAPAQRQPFTNTDTHIFDVGKPPASSRSELARPRLESRVPARRSRPPSTVRAPLRRPESDKAD